ncbi:Adenine phosphoribosyltransferase [Clostridiaceae bacterium JG1575]|nr:Adenine phosphoribosyltransferase [Clostridiaceae bacterium JG1575]
MEFKDHIRIIENFPKEGISFKDITTLIQDGPLFHRLVDEMAQRLKDLQVDAVAGPEARGFIFGVPVAYALGVGFIPIRKKGKLPGETVSLTYELEYGSDTLEVHKDAIPKGLRVALIDDLLATGGTINACRKLLERAGAQVVSIDFVIELTDLHGRNLLSGYDVVSMAQYKI